MVAENEPKSALQFVCAQCHERRHAGKQQYGKSYRPTATGNYINHPGKQGCKNKQPCCYVSHEFH